VLGVHVQRLATIAHGDGVCTTHIPQTRPSTGSGHVSDLGPSTGSGHVSDLGPSTGSGHVSDLRPEPVEGQFTHDTTTDERSDS
jgi:hypothetical protein